MPLKFGSCSKPCLENGHIPFVTFSSYPICYQICRASKVSDLHMLLLINPESFNAIHNSVDSPWRVLSHHLGSDSQVGIGFHDQRLPLAFYSSSFRTSGIKQTLPVSSFATPSISFPSLSLTATPILAERVTVSQDKPA